MRSDQPDGRGGYVRIKPGADAEHARRVLTEERDAALAEVQGASMPYELLNVSVQMQMLILTELLLARPDQPIDVRLVQKAQHPSSPGRLAENIEEAAAGLVMMFPRTFETVAEV